MNSAMRSINPEFMPYNDINIMTELRKKIVWEFISNKDATQNIINSINYPYNFDKDIIFDPCSMRLIVSIKKPYISSETEKKYNTIQDETDMDIAREKFYQYIERILINNKIPIQYIESILTMYNNMQPDSIQYYNYDECYQIQKSFWI